MQSPEEYRQSLLADAVNDFMAQVRQEVDKLVRQLNDIDNADLEPGDDDEEMAGHGKGNAPF